MTDQPASESIRLGRREIEGSQPGSAALIIGGVHGDEFESMAAIRRLIHTLEPASLKGRVILIPAVNEPAFWRGQRTAEDGLDLARTCPGRADGSITERLAHAVSAEIRAVDYLIDLHSGGMAMRMCPTAGYTLHPDPVVLETQRRMARAFGLPIVWGTTSRLDGRTLSVARDAGIPAIYCEWLGAGECDPAGVETYVEGCLNVLGELGVIDRRPSPSRIRYEVEDGRDAAGHLQVNYPAPFAGFFESCVELEQPVHPVDRIGVLYDLLGERHEEIRCTQTGIVLCVRVFPRVAEGDSLAAILELPPAEMPPARVGVDG